MQVESKTTNTNSTSVLDFKSLDQHSSELINIENYVDGRRNNIRALKSTISLLKSQIAAIQKVKELKKPEINLNRLHKIVMDSINFKNHLRICKANHIDTIGEFKRLEGSKLIKLKEQNELIKFYLNSFTGDEIIENYKKAHIKSNEINTRPKTKNSAMRLVERREIDQHD